MFVGMILLLVVLLVVAAWLWGWVDFRWKSRTDVHSEVAAHDRMVGSGRKNGIKARTTIEAIHFVPPMAPRSRILANDRKAAGSQRAWVGLWSEGNAENPRHVQILASQDTKMTARQALLFVELVIGHT